MLRDRFQEWLYDLRMVRQKGSFARNAAFAFSGTAVITLSQIVLTPVVAYIYGPEAYGIYGIYLAICVNLAAVADMGLSVAYVLPKEEEKAMDLLRSNFILLAMTLVLLLPFLFVRGQVYQAIPSWNGMGIWYYTIPIGVAVQAFPNMLTQWLARKKAFGRSAFLGGGSNLILRLFNMLYGLLTNGALYGLILGELVVRGSSVLVYFRSARITNLFAHLDLKRLWNTVKEYRNYPLFIFPGRYVSLLGQQAPIFMLSGDPIAVGQFAFAAATLLMPLRLIGYSLGTVFQQKAAETYRDSPKDLARITVRFHDRLFILGLVPFVAIAFFSDVVFRVILGDDWVLSGIFAAWMSFFFFLRLLTEPITSLLTVLRRESSLLYFHGALLMGRMLVLWFGIFELGSIPLAILGYAVVSMIGHGALLAYIFALVGIPWARPLIRGGALVMLVSLVFCAARYYFLGDLFPGPVGALIGWMP